LKTAATVGVMDGKAIDLRFGPAIQVAPQEFSVRVDGVRPEQAEAIRRRVADTLQQRCDMMGAMPELAPAPSAECGPIHVGLVGPFTDPDRQRDLENVVRTVVADELQSDRAAEAVCICASGVPGDEIAITAADIVWFVGGVWTPPPSGNPFWRIAVALDAGGRNWAELILRDGATFNPPVPRNQALVGLANITGWAKEIWSDNLCSGRLGSVFQGGVNTTPRRMLLDQASCANGADTIVFRKPGFLGIWYDVGHFPPGLFWRAFGGTWGDYTWKIG
jgi:hypothetical protein